MPKRNADIAAAFDEIADLLEVEQANPFRIRAYRNAARSLDGLGRDVAALVSAGEPLEELPGIGEDLAAKIREILATGKCSLLDRLRGEVPPAVSELLHVPGLGPGRVRALWQGLGIETVQQLQRAAREGRIRSLPGFGERSERKILQAVETHLDQSRRFERASVVPRAEALLARLARSRGVERVEVAGSYRRRRDTVGDLDILAIAAGDSAVMDDFTRDADVEKVLSKGPTRATVVLHDGLQVDLRVVAPDSYGAALCYFTGSKAHNLALRRIAQRKGLKLNEYGLFKGETRIAGRTEEELYHALGLSWIAPEQREDRGEIDAARLDHGC